MRQPASEAARVALEGSAGIGVSATRSRGDLLSANPFSRRPRVIGFQPWSRNPRLDASRTTAPADRARVFVPARPRQRVVAPFAANSPRAVDDGTLAHEPATATGAQDDAEHAPRAGPGTIHGLGKRKAVGVVGEPHWTAQVRLEVVLEGLAVEPRRVSVLHQAAHRRHRAWNAHADASLSTGMLLEQARH